MKFSRTHVEVQKGVVDAIKNRHEKFGKLVVVNFHVWWSHSSAASVFVFLRSNCAGIRPAFCRKSLGHHVCDLSLPTLEKPHLLILHPRFQKLG